MAELAKILFMIIISILHWKILAWAETKKLHTSKKIEMIACLSLLSTIVRSLIFR